MPSSFEASLSAALAEERECAARERLMVPSAHAPSPEPGPNSLDSPNELHNAWTDGYRLGLRDRNRPLEQLAKNPHDSTERVTVSTIPAPPPEAA